MATLNDVVSSYESLLITLDVLEDGKNSVALDLIKSRLLIAEQKKETRNWKSFWGILIASLCV